MTRGFASDRDAANNSQLDSVGTTSAETRAAARRYLERTGHADLVDMLGVGDPPALELPRPVCPHCRNRVPRTGVCRKAQRCREEAAKAVTP